MFHSELSEGIKMNNGFFLFGKNILRFILLPVLIIFLKLQGKMFSTYFIVTFLKFAPGVSACSRCFLILDTPDLIKIRFRSMFNLCIHWIVQNM